MKVWKKIGCFLLSLLFLISFTKKQVEAQSKDPMVLPVLTIGLDLQTSTSISGNRNRTLFIIGDSTSKSYHEKDKNTYPREGWGQEIFQSFRGAERVKRYTIPVKGDMSATQYVLPQITIESWGKSGATIKSCYESKRFSKILSRVREKDYVLIQFGHNDARKVWGETPNQYEKYLTDMVRKIKAKNAFPVLVTSLPQYNAKKFKINAPKYRMKMLKVSRTQKVACIDLNLECVNYFNLRGPKVIKNWYMFLDANKYKAYPKGLKDPTHFRKAGASGQPE